MGDKENSWHEERKIVGKSFISYTKRLERQIELIKNYAKERNWEIEILKDIGSGLKEDRKKFQT
ncbi:MAG: hypothetical protein DRP08_07370 [Candidatus Aenigmatarchaeota archaeon]|nr:MAG: hypothetical protein DRP08_07370 [Candidatus Aenigmarchaeota archaeon]